MSATFELNRIQFAIRYGILCIVVWTAAYLAAPYNWEYGWLAVPIMFALFFAMIRYLFIPRARNMGWSAWRLLWLLVPVAGIVAFVLLFFLPAKKNA